MPRAKGLPKQVYAVMEGVQVPPKPKDALIAFAAAAVASCEHANPTKAAVSILGDYYGKGVWALTAEQQDRKIKHVANRISVFMRRG